MKLNRCQRIPLSLVGALLALSTACTDGSELSPPADFDADRTDTTDVSTTTPDSDTSVAETEVTEPPTEVTEPPTEVTPDTEVADDIEVEDDTDVAEEVEVEDDAEVAEEVEVEDDADVVEETEVSTPECGNNVIDTGETCDGTALGVATCESQGFDGGTLGCNAECDGYVVDLCLDGEVPVGWTCNDNWYGQDDGCDCACGVQDPDCASTTDVTECVTCDGCDDSDCEVSVDPADTTQCVGDVEVPVEWICDPDWYTDDDCDCGCGIKDPVCAGTTDVLECEYCINCPGAGDCEERVDTSDTTQCRAFECGNGVADPGEDCDGADLNDSDCTDAGDFGGGTLACDGECNFDTTACTPIPAEWICDPDWYTDASCDCGCGAQDPQCANTTDVAECDFCTNCDGTGACGPRLIPGDTTQCFETECGDGVIEGTEQCEGADLNDATCESLGFGAGTLACDPDSCGFDTSGCTIPDGWECDPEFFADGTCDCGCGAPDSDCTSTSDVTECDFCDLCDPGSFSCDTDTVDPEDTTQCFEVPAGWTCDPDWYTDDDCDCGCGIKDPVCAGTTDPLECEFCIDCPGTGACGPRLEPDDTTLCLGASVCGDNEAENAEECDGTDLNDATCESLGFTGGTLACAACEYVTTGCTKPPAPDEWTCNDLFWGDGDCDCGCGVKDLDCADTDDLATCDICNCGAPFQEEDCSDYVDDEDTTQCRVAEPGDSCTNPIEAAGDTFSITIDTCDYANDFVATVETAGCESNSSATAESRDAVVHFVPATTGTFIAKATPTVAFDGILNVVADACPDTGTYAACLEGADSPEPPTLEFAATAGEDYYVILDGWSTGCGVSTIDISKRCDRTPGFCDLLACNDVDNCGVPCGCEAGEVCTAGECVATPGESCAAPLPLVQAGNVWTGTGTLVGATADEEYGTCPRLETNSFTPTQAGTVDQVWSFTSTEAGEYRIDLTLGGTSGDIYYYVFAGAACDDASCLGYVEAVTSGTETQSFTLAADTLYTIVVDSYSTSSTPAPYTLSVTRLCTRLPDACDTEACDVLDNCGVPCGCDGGEVCVDGTCETEPGESCADPRALTQAGNVWTGAGTLVGATADEDYGTCPRLETNSFTPTQAGTLDEVWTFTTTNAGDYRIDLLLGPVGDIYYYVFEGSTCDDASCLGYVEAVTSGTETQVFTLEAATVYTIVVDSYSTTSTPAPYTLTVTGLCARLPTACDDEACDALDNCGVPCGCAAGFTCEESVCVEQDAAEYDVCATAGELVLGEVITVDTCTLAADYTFDGDGCSEPTDAAPDAVFSYTAATAGDYVVDVLGDGLIDVVLNVVVADACPEPVLTCDDGTDVIGDGETLAVTLAADETVWVFVSGYEWINGDDCGEVDVSITATVPEVCDDTVDNDGDGDADCDDSDCDAFPACDVPALPLDVCSTAGTLVLDTLVEIDTCPLEVDYDFDVDDFSCAEPIAGAPEAVLMFEAPEDGDYTLTVDGLDPVVNVVVADVCPEVITTCDEGVDTTTEPEVVTVALLAGQTMWVFVSEYDDCGDLTVGLEQEAPPCVPDAGTECGTNVACDRTDSCGTPCTCGVGFACNTETDLCEVAAAPPGDSCANRIVVTTETFTQTLDLTTYAANFGAEVDTGGCAPNSASGVATSRDAILQFVPPTSGTYTVTATAATFDGILNVIEGATCPSAIYATCVDGADEPEPMTVTWVATAGTTYHIIVDGYGLASGGPTTIDITKQCERDPLTCDTEACDALDNCGVACGCDAGEQCVAGLCEAVVEEPLDVCSTAGTLVLDTLVEIDTCPLEVDYDFDVDDFSCAEPIAGAPDAVLMFEATEDGEYTLTVDGFDPVVNVVIADLCPDVITTCDEGVDTTIEPEFVTVELSAGETMWVFVSEYEDCGELTVELAMEEPPCVPDAGTECGTNAACDRTDSCGTPCVCGAGFTCNTEDDVCEVAAAPAGDSCANPIEVTTETFSQTLDLTGYAANFGASSGAAGCATNSSTGVATSRDAILRFVPPTNGTYTVSASADAFDGILNVVDGAGGCPSAVYGTCIAGADQPEPMTVTFTAVAGQAYFIIVDGWGATDFGATTINITKQCVPTPESACGTNSCDRADSCGTPCVCTGGNVCNTTTDLCEPPPAGPNDTCALAGTLALGTPVAFNSCALARDYTFGNGTTDSGGCQANNGAREGVFSFTAGAAATYRVSLTGAASTDAVINVLNGTCPAPSTTAQTCLAGRDGSSSGAETLDLTLTEGQQVFIFASGFGTTCNTVNPSTNLTLVVRPATETSCSGGTDEDGDGFIDCGDSDCSANAACASVPLETCTTLGTLQPGVPTTVNTCSLNRNYQFAGSGGCTTNSQAREAVFGFTNTAAGIYRVRVSGTPTIDPVLNVVGTPTCPAPQTTTAQVCTNNRDAGADGDAEQLDLTLAANTTRFFFVSGYGSTVSDCGPLTVLLTAPTEQACTGGVDDDGDTAIDCLDSDCAADPACVATPVEDCDDGVDNDDDTLADCDDDDCAAFSACLEGNTCEVPFALDAGVEPNSWEGMGDLSVSSVTDDFNPAGCALGTTYEDNTDVDQVFEFTVPTTGEYFVGVDSIGDVYWYLREGDVCETATCIGGVDDDTTGVEAAFVDLVAGTTYYLVVESWEGDGLEAYDVLIELEPPIEGDSCADPFSLLAGTGGGLEGDGDLTAAGVGDDFDFLTCTQFNDQSEFLSGQNTPDEVFQFTVPADGDYVITVESEADADMGFALFSGGDCATATCLGYMDSINEAGSEEDTAEVTLTAGTTYFLVVDTFSSTLGAGSYLVFVDPAACVPTTVCDGSTCVADNGCGVPCACDAGETCNASFVCEAPPAEVCTSELFFSEYLEGSGTNNKALEIYNPTGGPVNLAEYTVRIGVNGAAPASPLTLSGTLAAGEVFVICRSNATHASDPLPAIVAACDLVSATVANFNGDDALQLVKNGVVIDQIGVAGVDPGASWPVTGGTTVDATLVRNPNITNGTANWAVGATQWTVSAQNTTTFLGSHTGPMCDPSDIAAVTWSDVAPIFVDNCSGCHSAPPGSGNHVIGASNLATSYAASQQNATVAQCVGLSIGECALIRVRDGSMPATGDCAQNPHGPLCPTAAEQALIERWIEDGELP